MESVFNRKRNRLRRGQRRVLDGAACRGTGAIELTLKEIREPRAERLEKGRRTRAGEGRAEGEEEFYHGRKYSGGENPGAEVTLG